MFLMGQCKLHYLAVIDYYVAKDSFIKLIKLENWKQLLQERNGDRISHFEVENKA